MVQINNILITSAGRRVSLVQNFQTSVKKFSIDSKVYSCDLNPELSAACLLSDKYFKVPRVDSEEYLKVLLKLCIDNNISLVIPTIDTELSLLSDVKDTFLRAGIIIMVSTKEFCDTFYLKSTTSNFFNKYDIPNPRTLLLNGNEEYPLFAKLNNSSCSVGAMKIDDFSQATSLEGDYIFQEFIDGIEYTIDCFISADGKLKSVVPRQRLEVRAGEVSKAKTSKNIDIINAVKNLCKVLKGVYGVISVQLFLTEDGDVYFIEINPRFGGGYPLSYKAGADMAEMIIKDILGIHFDYSEDWTDKRVMLRYDAEVII